MHGIMHKKFIENHKIKKEIYCLKVALSQKIEVDFPNCPKWLLKKLPWDLKNENADFQLIDNTSRTYL